jgi:hypothetical protein
MIQAGIWTGRFAAKLNAPVRFAFAAAPCFSRILFAAKSVASPATPQTIAIPIEPLAASPLTPNKKSAASSRYHQGCPFAAVGSGSPFILASSAA